MVTKKVMIRKKVMKKKTYINDRGYMVTEDVPEWEEVETEVTEPAAAQPDTPTRTVLEKKPSFAKDDVKERKPSKKDDSDEGSENEDGDGGKEKKKAAPKKKAAAATAPKDGRVQKTMMSFFRKPETE